MNAILYFAIICACAVHIHSRTKEAPSLNDLLFFKELMQNPPHHETKNEPAAPFDSNNQIDDSDIIIEFLSPNQEQKEEKETKASSTHAYQKSDTSSANKNKMMEREAEAPTKNNHEIDFPFLLNHLISQRAQTMTAVPKHPQNTDGVLDLSELFALKENVMEREAEAPSKNNDEVEFSILLNNLLSQEDETTKAVPKHPQNTNEVFDFSQLFAPEEKLAEQKATASQTENEFDILELLNDVYSESEPSKDDVPELLRDLISGSGEMIVEMIPITSPKIGKELDIADILSEIIPPPEEPDVIIEIDEQIISVNMSLIDSASKYGEPLITDDENERPSKLNLKTKMNKFFADVIYPLQEQLTDQFERVLVPLNDVIELGADIKNSPFTEKEIKQLENFTLYMQTTQEIYNDFKSKVYSFGADHFYETSVLNKYHLSKEQLKQTKKVVNDAIERVRAESKAIYDLILMPENQQLIKSIENQKLELWNSLRAISLALKAKNAHLIDDDKMEDVKTKRLSIIEQSSKSIIGILQSKMLEDFGDKIIATVDKLVDIMNKLPMKITLSYMF